MRSSASHAARTGCFMLMACLAAIVNPVDASETDTLPTVELTFQAAAPEGVRITSIGASGFFNAVHRQGGVVSNDPDAAWRVGSEAPFGEGELDFVLDRSQLSSDLALVLRADWNRESDVAIQLFDDADRALSVDLFGNPAQNGAAAGTDTFVVPLSRYPLATRITVRRLSGSLAVHAAGLFPVLSEMPSSPESQQAIARQLGLVFAPGASGKNGKSANAILGTVHVTPVLERTNRIGADALAQTGYPVFRRLTEGALASESLAFSGTTMDFMEAALRSLAIESHSALDRPFFTSSNFVADYLLSGKARFGAMSVPLTPEQKETFRARNGFPVLEFEVAHDAIEVIVNAANPLREITIPQLDAIYAETPRAGAKQPVRAWSQLDAGAGNIHAYGGSSAWGTTRSFQEIVLKGGAFRTGITVSDVVFWNGIEDKVARDATAIGYVSLRPRQAAVRALAVAANAGEQAWPVDTQAIYSGHYPLQRKLYVYVARKTLADATALERELTNLLLSDAGQALVAKSGSLPLSASETAAGRSVLALPR